MMKHGGDIDGMDSEVGLRRIEDQPLPTEDLAETLSLGLRVQRGVCWEVRRKQPVSMRLVKPGVTETRGLKWREAQAEIADLPRKSSQTTTDDDRRSAGHETEHAVRERVEGGLPWADVSQDAERKRTGASTTPSTTNSIETNRAGSELRRVSKTNERKATVEFRCDVQRSASSRRRSRRWQAEDVSVRRCFPVLIPFPGVRSKNSADRTGLSPRCEKPFSIAALSVDGRPTGAAHPRAAWSSSGALASAGKLASRFLHERSRRRLAG